MNTTNQTPSNDVIEFLRSEHDPDPRKWSNAELAAGLNSLAIPECTMFVHRADRHNPKSDVQAVTLECASVLSYDSITQIAGLFETPHITFSPSVRFPDAAGQNPGEYAIEYAEPYFTIVVRWEAPVPVSKPRLDELKQALAKATSEPPAVDSRDDNYSDWGGHH